MIHLHTHSMYSLRDSIIKPEDLIKRLKEIGQDTVAITDHGGSLGGVTIYKQLKKAGIKYIHGVEFYVCDDLAVKDKTSKYYHLIALCKNETGRLNMNHLISLSERPENKYYKPRIDFNLLCQYGEGLVIMSACLAGEVAKKIMADDYEGAKQVALKYKERFGDDYYLEIQAHRDDDQVRVNREVLRLAEELNIKPVVTCDAHYTYEEDKKYQNKYAFGGAYREEGESYIDCFVQSEQEVRDRLSYLDKDMQDSLINTTHEIADKCNVELPLSAPIMPKVDTPEGYNSNSEWLTSLCTEGFKSKLNIDYVNHKGFEGCEFSQEKIDEYIDRFEYEKDSLERMGFIDYILLVCSYANVAERRGIARGSGGGSLICYLSNITDIDPVQYDLYFERFIDVGALKQLEAGEITPQELKVPDIDLDFSGSNCRDVLQFLYDKYGEDKVCSIGKFGTSKTKTTIRDMCKVLDIPLSEADKIAKSFGDYEISNIDKFIAEDKIPQNAKEAVANVRKYPELFDYVRKLVELPKSFGLHACGKVISTTNLDDYLPSCYDKDGIRFLQGDMHDVESVGLVKIDLLGLRTLDQIYDTLEMSGEDKSFLNSREMYKDPTTLSIFRNGDTLGVFQFASPGMKQTLQKMDVQGLGDLSVANALYRPGAIGYIDEYIARKNGEKPVTYIHPDLEPILKSTYGVMVYQEQVIDIGRMAGLHNPDLLRKAIAKKKPEVLAEVKPELEEKLKARGWTDEQFSEFWNSIMAFGKYSFNKCVSGDTRFCKDCVTKAKRNPSVAEMYKITHDLEFAKANNYRPLRSKYMRCGYGKALSMYPDGKIRRNQIVDIQPAGTREIYRLKTESGAYVDCTDNHKIPTPSGYKELKDLNIGDEVFVLGKYKGIQKCYNFTDGNFESNVPVKGQMGFQHKPDGASVRFSSYRERMCSNAMPCEVCGTPYDGKARFELHHKDGNRTNNDESNFCWCCVSCHKKLEYQLGRTKAFQNGLPSLVDKIASIEYLRTDEVYDVTMADPAHNFVTDSGLVVSNSHANAYAMLAYKTAKQKAYYPAEFYAGLLNSYIGHSDFVKNEADDIIADARRHKVYLMPFNFRDDHRRCSVRNGRIIYAIPLIRDMSESVAEVLYRHSDTSVETFNELIRELMSDGIGASSMKVLIRLGFFSEYGNQNELLRIFEVCESFKFGEIKQMKVSKLEEDDFMRETVLKHGEVTRTKTGELGKTVKIYDPIGILNDYEAKIKSLGLKNLDLKVRASTQEEYLGFVSLTTGKESDRPKLRVKDTYPLNRKSDGKQFGYSVITQSLGSGIETRFSVFNNVYNKDPISKGDFILCKSYKKDKGYFTLTSYEHIYD